MDIFSFPDYRSILTNWIASSAVRGGRTRLAKAASCNPSWLTRVLNSEVQLTPDQALGIAQALSLSEFEADYFLLLVDLERASTAQLRKRISNKLEAIRIQNRSLMTAINSKAKISGEASTKYYSSWIYGALHVASMIRPISVEEAASQLFLSKESVTPIFKDLRQMGLVEVERNQFKATAKSLHLHADQSLVNQGHLIWRNRTVQYLLENRRDGFSLLRNPLPMWR